MSAGKAAHPRLPIASLLGPSLLCGLPKTCTKCDLDDLQDMMEVHFSKAGSTLYADLLKLANSCPADGMHGPAQAAQCHPR